MTSCGAFVGRQNSTAVPPYPSAIRMEAGCVPSSRSSITTWPPLDNRDSDIPVANHGHIISGGVDAAPLNEQTRLISPFCVLSCNQSSSLFSGLLCRLRDSPVERFFYKFDGIDCCPKLGREIRQSPHSSVLAAPPPINSATHCFFDGCYHLIDGDVAVGLCHSLASLFRAAAAETTSFVGARRGFGRRW
jgi:hypothetical protein